MSPVPTHEYTVSSDGARSYGYDEGGNQTTINGVTRYTWNTENLPISMIGPDGVSETYGYDGDGERVKKTRSGITTIYLEGLWEEVVGGVSKVYYPFNGALVAMHDGSSAPVYLHGDHLGSISLVTNASGALFSQQEFDPWGALRSAPITQTSLNYTGQRLDATDLLYYHARYYNPVLARFLSPDTVVPGNASGSMEGIALKPLTVDFHEPKFVSSLSDENRQPFWFQMTDEERQNSDSPWGSHNPQSLNRYSYVLNNPLRYTDPSGHCFDGATTTLCLIGGAAAVATAPAWVVPVAIGVGVIFVAAGIAYVASEAITTKRVQGDINPIFLAKKEDIRFIDHLVRKYGLTKDQRRELHDEITKQGYSKEEIEEIARQLAGEDDDYNYDDDESDEE